MEPEIYFEAHDLEREPDPEPLSIILEIMNLIIQPGTLAAIVGGAGAAAQTIITYKDINERKRSDIRRNLYEIDRALTKGFSSLMTLTSLLDEFNYKDRRWVTMLQTQLRPPVCENLRLHGVRVLHPPLHGWLSAQTLT